MMKNTVQHFLFVDDMATTRRVLKPGSLSGKDEERPKWPSPMNTLDSAAIN